jgi:DNA-binding NtrC family response regulator
VLETGTFMRVGSTQTLETDVRMIAATNRSPLQAVASGKLREDLLYRLNVFPIHLPALRQRSEDVPLLAEHFVQQISEREGMAKRFSPQALQRLARYEWPGNVRELRNVVYRSYVMALDSTIDDECLPQSPDGEVSGASIPTSPMVVEGGAPAITVWVGTPLAEIERQVTLATLEYLGRHKEKTAATLGISLKTLYNRLKEYQSAGLAGADGALETRPAGLEDRSWASS